MSMVLSIILVTTASRAEHGDTCNIIISFLLVSVMVLLTLSLNQNFICDGVWIVITFCCGKFRSRKCSRVTRLLLTVELNGIIFCCGLKVPKFGEESDARMGQNVRIYHRSFEERLIRSHAESILLNRLNRKTIPSEINEHGLVLKWMAFFAGWYIFYTWLRK